MIEGYEDQPGHLSPVALLTQSHPWGVTAATDPQTLTGGHTGINDVWFQYSLPPPPPPPPTTAVRFGLIISDASGYWTNTTGATYNPPLTGDQPGLYQLAWRDYGSAGTGPYAKFFDGGSGINTPWNAVLNCNYGSKPNETSVTLCYKGGFNQTNFVNVCRAAVARFPEPIRVVWNQEIDRSAITPAQWQAHVTQQWDTIQADSQLAGNVEIWLSTTGYRQYEAPAAGQQMENYLSGMPSRVQVKGMQVDIYQFNTSNIHPTYDPTPELTNLFNRTTALGLAFHMGEWGTTPLTWSGAGDTDAKRATRTQKYIDFCTARPYNPATGTGCTGGSWWENYAGDPSVGANTESDQGLLSKETIWPLTFALVKNTIWPGP